MNIVQVGPFPLSADCIRGGVESSVFGLVNELSRNHVVDVFDYPRINGKDSVERKGPLTTPACFPSKQAGFFFLSRQIRFAALVSSVVRL